MILKDVVKILEDVAPLSLQAEYDNSGWQVGDENAAFTGAIVSLDVTEGAVNECAEKGCNLLIAHHPLLFHPLRRVTSDYPVHKALAAAIRQNIAVYCAHTNADFASGGLNDRFLSELGLKEISDLPDGMAGRSGTLPQEKTLREFSEHVKTVTQDRNLWYLGNGEKVIRQVVAVNGAGADEEILLWAAKGGADVFLTSEWKYHLIRLAKELNCAIINCGHYESERFFLPWTAELLQKGGIRRVFLSETCVSPFSNGR